MKWTTDCRWQALALGIAVLASVSGAQAQDDVETVVVTGSRIRQDPLNQPAPLVTVTMRTSPSPVSPRSAICCSGCRSPAAVSTPSSTRAATSASRRTAAASAPARPRPICGTSASKRVLVLVDGMRWVNESSASGVSAATDLNTIPTSIIDHIEVLQDGASSIYGSDAIAGVVNIITKKTFEGIEFSGYGGGYDEGDGDTQQFNISAGTRLGHHERVLRRELRRTRTT